MSMTIILPPEKRLSALFLDEQTLGCLTTDAYKYLIPFTASVIICPYDKDSNYVIMLAIKAK